MGQLGFRSASGLLLASNQVTAGAWVVTFTPEMLPSESEFEVWHGTARGPGGYFLVFIDSEQYGVGQNGLINEYAPSIPMFVRKGQSITLHWSIATGTAPRVWFRFRQPEVGRL